MVSGPAAERAMVTKEAIPSKFLSWTVTGPAPHRANPPRQRLVLGAWPKSHCIMDAQMCENELDIHDDREPIQQTLLPALTFSSTQSGHRETPRLRIVVWVVQPSEAE